MYLIFNERTDKQLLDEYGSPVEFYNEWTAEIYYGRHCKNMMDVVIKEDNCICPKPLIQFNFNTDYCKRCDKLVIKETI